MKNDNDLFKELVGHTYGPDPASKLAEILSDKKHNTDLVLEKIHLNQNDIVAEIGAGCGWTAKILAPKVSTYLCLDICPHFLTYAKKELSEFGNVYFDEMTFGNLEKIQEMKANKIIAMSVFTQFNLHDIVIYLKEIYRVLPAGGQLYFDYMNIGYLDILTNRSFLRHNELYQKNRHDILKFVHWHQPEFLEKCLSQLGFKIISMENLHNHSSFTVEK